MPPIIHRTLRTPALVAGLVFAAACADSPTAPIVVATVNVSPATLTLASGATGALTATVQDDRGRTLEGRPITWISTDPDLLTISASGALTAGANRTVDARTVTILASSGGQVGSASVTVTPVAVAALRVTPDTTPLDVGAKSQLTAVLEDASGSALDGRTVTFTALDPAVATVTATGLVTAQDYTGPEVRSARVVAAHGGVADTAVIVVAALPVASVVLSADALTLVQGGNAQLTAQARSADGRLLAGRSLVWASSDSAQLQVSPTGALEATPAFLGDPLEVTVSVRSEGRADTARVRIVSGFELAENGLTIRCPLAQPGDSGRVGGVVYTKRTREELDVLVDLGPQDALPTSCTSGITDMSRLFFGRTQFNQRIDRWDVSAVTDMSAMFRGAQSFTQPIGAWDVRQVTRMDDMFAGASSFNQPIEAWDVGNVTDMTRMFDGAIAFNQPLNRWNVSKVTSLRSMFSSARSFNQPLNTWDVRAVQDMSATFAVAWAFNQPLDAWDVSNVESMGSMFAATRAFNQPIGNWDVGNVRDMSFMFSEALEFNQDISSWDVSRVTTMRQMFESSSFNQSISRWDVGSVTDFTAMFRLAPAFNQDLSVWCVAGVGTAPEEFAAGAAAWARPQPAWGTCSPISLERSVLSIPNPLVILNSPFASTEIVIEVRGINGALLDVPPPPVRLGVGNSGSLGPVTQDGVGRFRVTYTGGDDMDFVVVRVELDGPAKTLLGAIAVIF